MTNRNCIVPTQLVQDIDSLANVILAMANHYPLPQSLECVIDELNLKTESLQLNSKLNLSYTDQSTI